MSEEKTTPHPDEIATAEKDIDIFAGWLNRLENPDPVLRTESAGKGLKLYDEVDRDPHAGAVLQSRALAVVGRDREILPAGPDSRSQKIADFITQALEDTNFDQAIQELLQGVLYGFFVGEIIWTYGQGGVVPEKIRAKHPRRFLFTTSRDLRLLTPEDMIEGGPVPDRKFIVFTFGSSDNPYGKGLGQRLWWPVWFKKNAIKFWLIFAEKFGAPTPVGKYPAGTPPEQQQALLDAIDAIQNETGVKIPDTMTIELLEAVRSGSINTYETLCDYMDRQISKAVLGQTLTTEVKGEGSYAASKTHDDVRRDIVRADADLLCECLNGTLIRWLVDFNFPGVTAYPKLRIRTETEKDLKPLAERDKILTADIGLPVGQDYLYGTYNIPRPEDGEDIVTVPQPRLPAGQGGAGAAFAAQADALDALGDKTASAADLNTLTGPIEALLESADSLEDFRDSLLDLYGDMDTSDLGTLMQQAFTLADLAGRFDADQR